MTYYKVIATHGTGMFYSYVTNGQSITSLEEIEEVDFNLFPNPANNQINISIEKGNEIGAVSIYNAMGKLVYNRILQEIKHQLT